MRGGVYGAGILPLFDLCGACAGTMGKRYVPKTYNNHRVFRIIVRTATSVVVAAVVLFLLLFFGLRGYWNEGRLEIPWLSGEANVSGEPITPEG